MSTGRVRLRMTCPHCRSDERLDAAELSARLRTLGMLKRDDQRDAALLLQLAKAAGGRLTCSKCGSGGMQVEVAEGCDEWEAPAKACAACGKAIPPERLELFPESELCAACQQRVDRGQTPAEHDDYCRRCGSRLVVRQRRGSGIAGYEMFCPDCGR